MPRAAPRQSLEIILEDLRVTQIRPLMLAVALSFSEAEASRAFRLFVSWSVRFLIAGGRGGLLDRNYSLIAKEVGDKKITTADQLVQNASFIPSDAVFESAFAEASVSQNYLARYYLRALELERKVKGGHENVPNKGKAVNVEHILPENPGTYWPHIPPEVAAAHYRRIGNMALMLAAKNSVIGNSAFSDKVPIFGGSGFILTSELTKYKTWDVASINSRQKDLASLAVRAWPNTAPAK